LKFKGSISNNENNNNYNENDIDDLLVEYPTTENPHKSHPEYKNWSFITCIEWKIKFKTGKRGSKCCTTCHHILRAHGNGKQSVHSCPSSKCEVISICPTAHRRRHTEEAKTNRRNFVSEHSAAKVEIDPQEEFLR